MQTLVLEGLTLQVEASFKDDGQPPEYGMSGRSRVLLQEGHPGHPEVFYCQGQFFFGNGELVTKEEQIDWISEPYRTMALQFLADQAKKPQPKAGPARVKLPKRVKLQTRGEVLGGRKVELDPGLVDQAQARLQKQGVED